jgi:hypothetical protein
MPGYLLHEGITITCPHGGSATLSLTNARVSVAGQLVALATDPTTVAGCAFNVAGALSPCVRVQWLLPTTRVSIAGTPVLLSTSVGLCLQAGGVPQGPAQVSGYQTRVSAQ